MAELTSVVAYPGDGHTWQQNPVLVIRLYCWAHQAVHELPIEDVEKLVYALQAAEKTAWQAGADDPRMGHLCARDPMDCPFEIRKWAEDSELFAEHVEQGSASREAGVL